jgi:hypothetical protein
VIHQCQLRKEQQQKRQLRKLQQREKQQQRERQSQRKQQQRGKQQLRKDKAILELSMKAAQPVAAFFFVLYQPILCFCLVSLL